MKISDRIFELIKERGLTQREFSEITGIPQSTISDWKSKGLNPSADKLLVISNTLKISVYDLLSASDECGKYIVDYTCIDNNSSEKELIEIYRKLPSNRKERLMGYAQALANGF